MLGMGLYGHTMDIWKPLPDLGFVGCFLLAWLLFQSIRSATNHVHQDFEYGRLRLVLLLTILVMNYSEATFTVGNHLWWFGFLVVAVYAEPWVYAAQMKRAIASENGRQKEQAEE